MRKLRKYRSQLRNKKLNFIGVFVIVLICILGIFPLSSNEKEVSNDGGLEDTVKIEDSYSSYIIEGAKIKVHYIDVGEGDSIFIELPNDMTMLIDAGESNVSSYIAEYIRDLGYLKIDYLIGTHPHADHIGGMSYIINNFVIGKIYMPKAISTSKTYENLLNTIVDNNLKVTTAKVGVSILNIDNLRVDIIAPNSDNYSDLNNYSAVIKIVYKNKSFLFMGDAERVSEDEIKTDVSVDVIKVGHHGSDTSSSASFVKKVNAKYAIISVGADNEYNHPSEDVVSRFQSSGAKVYRTDLNGNIIVTSDGDTLEVTTSK